MDFINSQKIVSNVFQEIVRFVCSNRMRWTLTLSTLMYEGWVNKSKHEKSLSCLRQRCKLHVDGHCLIDFETNFFGIAWPLTESFPAIFIRDSSNFISSTHFRRMLSVDVKPKLLVISQRCNYVSSIISLVPDIYIPFYFPALYLQKHLSGSPCIILFPLSFPDLSLFLQFSSLLWIWVSLQCSSNRNANVLFPNLVNT